MPKAKTKSALKKRIKVTASEKSNTNMHIVLI